MGQVASSVELAERIVRRLQGAGRVAYFAGGCVRDRLMGREPKDFDVATSAVPGEVMRLFPRSQQVGAAFGVILVKEKGKQVEVATFRADGVYSDGRHPDSVRFTTAAEEDARRRDFTCNGLFFDPVTGELHDFVGGRRDIEGKVLRAIGEARERFAEDHLRMLRAVRFAARLGFAMEAGTRAAIEEMQGRIEGISRERIGEELRMILEHPARVEAMEILAGFEGLFAEVFGFSRVHGEEGWPVLSGLPERVGGGARAVGLAAVVMDCGLDLREAGAILRERLMLSNDEMEVLGFIAEKLPLLEGWEDLSKAALKRMMADARWGDLERIYLADPGNAEEVMAFGERTGAMLEEGVSPVPLVTGAELIGLGVSPGPAFKKWLDVLYDRQLEGEFADAGEALAAAKLLIAKRG